MAETEKRNQPLGQVKGQAPGYGVGSHSPAPTDRHPSSGDLASWPRYTPTAREVKRQTNKVTAQEIREQRSKEKDERLHRVACEVLERGPTTKTKLMDACVTRGLPNNKRWLVQTLQAFADDPESPITFSRLNGGVRGTTQMYRIEKRCRTLSTGKGENTVSFPRRGPKGPSGAHNGPALGSPSVLAARPRRRNENDGGLNAASEGRQGACAAVAPGRRVAQDDCRGLWRDRRTYPAGLPGRGARPRSEAATGSASRRQERIRCGSGLDSGGRADQRLGRGRREGPEPVPIPSMPVRAPDLGRQRLLHQVREGPSATDRGPVALRLVRENVVSAL